MLWIRYHLTTSEAGPKYTTTDLIFVVNQSDQTKTGTSTNSPNTSGREEWIQSFLRAPTLWGVSYNDNGYMVCI